MSTGHQGQNAKAELQHGVRLSLHFTHALPRRRAPPKVRPDPPSPSPTVFIYFIYFFQIHMTWFRQKKDGEWGPAHAQPWGAQAVPGAAGVAADEAPGHPHTLGPARQRRGGPAEEEAASRGAVRSEPPDPGGDSARPELLGEAARVEAVMMSPWILFNCLSFFHQNCRLFIIIIFNVKTTLIYFTFSLYLFTFYLLHLMKPVLTRQHFSVVYALI